jgi:hypothetical protein
MGRSLAIMALVTMLAAVPGTAQTIDYTDSSGRSWRDLNDTLNFTWYEIDAICPNDGVTPCSGTLGSVDFTGWIWATHDQVNELFKEVSGLTLGELDDYFHYDVLSSPWAAAALSHLSPTRTTALSAQLRAWASTPPNPPSTTAVWVPSIVDCFEYSFECVGTVDTVDGVVTAAFTAPDFRQSWLGTWLFRREIIADIDGDGVPDAVDQCPEQFGDPANNGCPIDSDGDGVPDAVDQCPEQFGDPSNNGCPTDTDGDGLYDYQDKCPDRYGERDNDGCPTPPTDRDGDGVADDIDECPDEFGLVARRGCPAPRRSRPPTRDLVVDRATFTAFPEPGAGWNLPPSYWMVFPVAVIRNDGVDSARNFAVTFAYGNGLTERVTVAELRPGESLFVAPPRDRAGRGTTLQPGSYVLTVTADPGNQISETDESNNVYQLSLVLPSR